MALVMVQILIILVILVFLGIFIYTLKQGAVSVPTKRAAVAQMIELAEIKPGEKALDIGSGDSRVVIALAEAGALAYGCEINPVLVWYSRLRIWQKGLRGQAFVSTKSFWRYDVSDFAVVTVFGIPGIMERLRLKLQAEMQSGSRVISNIFTFPAWPPDKTLGTVRRYRVR